MSLQYTSDGRRKSSMAHARHGYTCICGKVTRGNGARASHRKACELRSLYIQYQKQLESWPAPSVKQTATD